MLNKKDNQILKLKAAMWEAGNEALLLSKAIRTYQDIQSEGQPVGDVQIIIQGKKIRVTEVPHFLGENECYENLHLTATLEEVIEELYGEQIPEQVHFEELLK